MGNNIDKETYEMLVKALKDIRNLGEKMRAKREKKLWEEIKIPCSLKDFLKNLTKNELTKIRQNLDLKGLSSLNKHQLIDRLESEIVSSARKVFLVFDNSQYKLIKKIIENDGMAEIDIDTLQAEYFRNRGIIFSGTIKGKRVLVMPQELLTEFQKLDNNEYQKIVRRNTDWIRLAQGLLFYYGTLGLIQLTDMIAKLMKSEKIELVDFIKVVNNAVEYYSEIRHDLEGYSNCRVFDSSRIKIEHKKRPDLDFYPFTYEQIYKAGAPGYVDKNFAFMRFSKFIIDNYDITVEEAENLVEECVYAIKIGDSLNQILEFLQEELEISDFETLQEFAGQVTFLHNNTRQWFLKGYTPEELFREEKKYMKPLPPKNFQSGNGQNKLKIGRNEPCPCGSGKKYKKCCGKNV